MYPVLLADNPAEQLANSSAPSFMGVLEQRERRLKKKIVYESEDFRNDDCTV